jgi:hypothetical protein
MATGLVLAARFAKERFERSLQLRADRATALTAHAAVRAADAAEAANTKWTMPNKIQTAGIAIATATAAATITGIIVAHWDAASCAASHPSMISQPKKH